MSKVAVELDRVSETLLWTLYHRAVEARRPDAVLADPLAIELVGRIEFPFVERFGDGGELAQWQALRARCFDSAVRAFVARNPGGTVVALGEGLETQFWRVDDGRVRWLTVDLADVVALRESLLPPEPRMRAVAASALDDAWLGEVDASTSVLLTAQGLLMYLAPEDVRGLVARCARRLRRSELVFDAVPRWLVERGRRGRLAGPTGYTPPPWQWWLDGPEERRLRALPHVARLQRVQLPRGRGLAHRVALPLASRAPLVQRLLPSVLVARFA